MRSIEAIRFVIVFCAFICGTLARSMAGEPATRPDMSDPNVVKWWAHCDLEDGRRFLTDGGLFLESRYVPNAPVPEKSVPPQGAVRLLQSNTDHEFGLADLNRNAPDGHYMAPGSIQLNRKYIELLRESPLKPTLRFRAEGPNDPVLIVDGQKVVGVMMPMKSVGGGENNKQR